MEGRIYVLHPDQSLEPLTEQPYTSEDVLQSLVERYPDLLAGEQIDPSEPRRWVLVAREIGVPGDEGAADRWALDHLFLDQSGIPTLVEVKRSTDTRIRREVVGQMLDYAANAVLYWPVESLRARFESACAAQGDEPDAVLGKLLGTEEGADVDPDGFWLQVKTNLQAGRIRMVFVADQIPNELRRIVEFLNAQMDPAEVLALELQQYVGSGLRTLVPRLLGQTAEAQQKKGSPRAGARQWDEVSFMADLGARHGEAAAGVARRILEWAHLRGLRIWWGKGAKDGSFFPMLDLPRGKRWTISVWTYGTVEIQFQQIRQNPPFDDEARRLELLQRFNQVPGIRIPQSRLNARPSFPIDVLENEAAFTTFTEVLDWVLQAYRDVDKS